MSDIAMVWDLELAAMDMAIVNDDLLLDDGLETAVLHSEFADRRASEEDQDASPTDLRGYWGDEFADVQGDQWGSRLWRIFERGLLTPDFEAQVSARGEEGLAWMIEDNIAASITVEVTTDDATSSAALSITIERPDDEDVNFLFAGLWEAQLG